LGLVYRFDRRFHPNPTKARIATPNKAKELGSGTAVAVNAKLSIMARLGFEAKVREVIGVVEMKPTKDRVGGPLEKMFVKTSPVESVAVYWPFVPKKNVDVIMMSLPTAFTPAGSVISNSTP